MAAGGLSGESDFVVVANRLPVDMERRPDGSTTWKRSPGGLVTALEPILRRHRGAWIGWPGIADEILDQNTIETMMREICEPRAWDKYAERGDLDFAYEMDADNRFRCNYFKQQHGLGCVFRIIPTKIASLEQLGIPPVVKEFGHMRGGLVLVTGPTGSGKSTTLAALLDYINVNFRRHIITIEEPIEFVHRNKKSIITQREVPIQTPSFADGLRAALRQPAGRDGRHPRRGRQHRAGVRRIQGLARDHRASRRR